MGFRGHRKNKGSHSFDSIKSMEGRDFRPRELHTAVCSDCGNECQVPFKPSKDREGKQRPVYCRDCFRNHKN